MHTIQANVHVIQNPTDPKLRKHVAYFIPFWPQYNLIKRSADRSVENLSYRGWQRWQDWHIQKPPFVEKMTALGMKLDFRFEDRSIEWHDYSKADIVLAVRSFDGNSFVNKPATKLYNAWCAEVPAILGPESAYQALRRGPLDFLEVKSEEEVVVAIKRLKEDPQLYKQMVENGQQRSADFSTERVLQHWLSFIENLRGLRKW